MDAQYYRNLGELLYQNSILPKDIGVASRMVSYWKTKDLLPFFPTDIKKHGKMNATQAVWMLIIQELTDIGVSTARLQKLSHDVWKLPRKKKYAEDVISKTIRSKKSKLSRQDITELKAILENDKLMQRLNLELNPFTDTLKSSLAIHEQPHYMIYAPLSGKHEFVCDSPETVINLNGKYAENPIICIPLLDKLSKVLSIEINSPKKDLGYLTAIQNQIRDIVIFKKPKSVVITSDENQIKPITITEKHIAEDELAEFFLRNKIPKGAKLLIEARAQNNYKLTLITK